MLNRRTEAKDAGSVRRDNAGGGKGAAELLLRNGHTRVACCWRNDDHNGVESAEISVQLINAEQCAINHRTLRFFSTDYLPG